MQINLDFKLIKELAAEVEEIGKTQFLVKHNAISVDEKGAWAVKHYEGLKLEMREALPGHIYETDIPYQFWQEVLRQVEYYIFKREQRKKEQEKATAPIETNDESTNGQPKVL